MSLHTKTQSIPTSHKKHVELPIFEKTPQDVKNSGEEILQYSKKRVSEIGSQSLDKVSFASSLLAMDELDFEETKVLNRFYLLQNAHPDQAVREAAREAFIQFQQWSVEKAYDEGLYRVVQAYAQKKETLQGEDKKLLDETLLEYRRLGMQLPKKTREEIQGLQKKLSELESQFSRNIQENSDALYVEREKLSGLDENFIRQLSQNKDGLYRISLDYPEYLPVIEHGENESLRRDLLCLKYRVASEENSKLLNEIVFLRDKIANLLGYSSWNEYVIERRMAKTPETVFRFLERLRKKLEEKGKQEMQELTALKRKFTNDPKVELKIWDYYFYSSFLKREKFQIDTQKLKEYFQLDRVLKGLFEIISQLFSVRIEAHPKSESQCWSEEVQLYRVSNTDGTDIGFFYLDLHPREGKYNHAAVFGLTEGRLLANGEYQCPVATMLCNFSRPSKDRPALLAHSEVETLFHEFGHVMHSLMTQARYTAFAGTHVAWDFVEAPSQVLENWVWDYEALQKFASHYRDPKKKLDPKFVEQMNQAEKAGSALFYLRQLSLALSDMELHKEGDNKDSVEVTNRISSAVFLPVPEETSFVTGWGHMVGYASGYYGYAWADVMAADLFSEFRKNGIFDPKTGYRLRKEIYEPGSSRDENESLKAFLGRELSEEAFFEDKGI